MLSISGTVHQFGFEEEREFQGVSIEIVDYTAGLNKDTMKVAVVAPDGAGGWVPMRYLVKGESSYDSTIPPSGGITVIAEGTITLHSFLQIQATHPSTAPTGNKPYTHRVFRTGV